MIYAKPGTSGSIVDFAGRYDNFIGGEWTAPVEGRYFDNSSPVDGEVFCEVA
ncbi:aldehyde dehydrogenase, partial [Nocardia sp. AB354]